MLRADLELMSSQRRGDFYKRVLRRLGALHGLTDLSTDHTLANPDSSSVDVVS